MPLGNGQRARSNQSDKQMTLTGNPLLVNPTFDNPPANPLMMLQDWLVKADEVGVSEPKGLVLSTVDSAGRPSSRVVLLKDCDERGVLFTTSQDSTKGKDLEANPYAAGTLWWRETIQQVNFQGPVTRLSQQVSDKEFQARPRDAQAVAAVSKQSAPLVDEKELEAQVHELLHAESKIDRLQGWHAYHLAIESIEFWHGRTNRLHRRLRYHLENGTWVHQRLQP